jgi:hypothetical protein
MTWVIGSPTMFGYCVGMADIQATYTLKDGKRVYGDCVQKIYPVGRFILAGFCGSIPAGFALLKDLRQYLQVSSEEAKNGAWIPDYVSFDWQRRAKRLYHKGLREEYRLPVPIMLLSCHPVENNGIPGEPKTYGCIMKSPEFNPIEIKANHFASIGSGNDVKEYMQSLESFNKDVYNDLMQMEVNNPGGYGNVAMIHLSIDVENNPKPGISKHFHNALVKRDSIVMWENNHQFIPDKGEIVETKMPRVAKNWEEFKSISKELGIGVSETASAKA